MGRDRRIFFQGCQREKTKMVKLRNKFSPGEDHPRYKHGLYNHKLYKVWQNMRRRCYYSKLINYQDYGGRGIRVSIRWKNNFVRFYKWAIKNGWQEGLQIDRINNDGNYHPNNCRFVTRKINMNNRRPEKLSKNNTTGYKGVYFHKASNKYRSIPYINGKLKHLGYFHTAKEAAQAIEAYK